MSYKIKSQRTRVTGLRDGENGMILQSLLLRHDRRMDKHAAHSQYVLYIAMLMLLCIKTAASQ